MTDSHTEAHEEAERSAGSEDRHGNGQEAAHLDGLISAHCGSHHASDTGAHKEACGETGKGSLTTSENPRKFALETGGWRRLVRLNINAEGGLVDD